MSRQDKSARYIAAAKAVAKAVAEAAAAEAAVTKAVDAADLDLFPHTNAVARADAHAKAVAEASDHYIAVAKTAALEKIKAEMRKHNGKT
ncbi:MAG: hypothetical protein Q7J98_00740 [Kiritimatiellia bacterium]|nr:hypothetical protein [Kiritimatiellia bacterium]